MFSIRSASLNGSIRNLNVLFVDVALRMILKLLEKNVNLNQFQMRIKTMEMKLQVI